MSFDLDKAAGDIISDDERGIDTTAAFNALFSALTGTGLDLDAAFVARHKALDRARKRRTALRYGLAHAVALGEAVDGAADQLRVRVRDFEVHLERLRSEATIDMDASALADGWREVLFGRIAGKSCQMATWVPQYETLRDASKQGSEGVSN